MRTTKKRIRPRLLILLWVWAILMFVVVDLFRNVPELDRVRPEWDTYREMRLAAHRMVDEPLDFGDAMPLLRGRSLGTRLESVDRLNDRKLLVEVARDTTSDSRVRGRAMRRLAHEFQAQDVLAGIAYSESESTKVRATAARYLAHAGAADEATHLADDASAVVREGARLGLAELGTADAARALVARKDNALLALVFKPAAVPVLADIAATTPTACTALGNTKSPDAVAPLVEALGAPHPKIRAAAAEALGRLGRPEALEAVDAACKDWHASVVKEAKLARQRLRYEN